MDFSRRSLLATAPATLAGGRTTAAAGRKLSFSEEWPTERIAAALISRAEWKPYPRIQDRHGWQGLDEAARAAAIKAGERQLRQPWQVLPATLFLEFAREGNRSRYEAARDERREALRELAIAEAVEGKGRFLDQIANGIWATCEETYWGVPAHINMQKAGKGLPDVAEPTVDLFAAETGSLLAWTDYLLNSQLDAVSPLIRKRVRLEIDRRILLPCRTRTDFWWMGLTKRDRPVNNWNPWINSNWLTCVLLMEADERRRAADTYKSLFSLDNFVQGYHEDGGCDEGPGYWGRAGASLFDCLDLLHSASGARMDFYKVPLVREIGRYIYRAHIAGNWYTNFGDAPPRMQPAGDLVYRYGRRIEDASMQALGAWVEHKHGEGRTYRDSIGRVLPALFNRAEIGKADGQPPLIRDAWLSGIQVMVARSRGGSTDGLYLAAQGGHNAESHNHNDVGNFIVFANGQPLFIDIGVETYSAKTFSAQRYDIWTMQSAWHNLPTVNGLMQAAGEEFRATNVAYEGGETRAQLTMELTQAYPAEAGIESWRRTHRLDRSANEIAIVDETVLRDGRGPLQFTLMTPRRPTVEGGELRFEGATAVFDSSQLAATVDSVEVKDGRLRNAWGDTLYRILLTAAHPQRRATYTVRIRQS